MPIIRIAIVLDLQPLIFVERRQQQAKLLLKFVQVGNRTVGEVGRFKDKALGDIPAAPERIEQNQIAHEKSVGGAFKHKSDMPGFAARGRVHYLLHASQVVHQLFNGSGAVNFIDGDTGFLNVRQRPLQMRAGDAAEAMCMQAAPQRGLCGFELAQQRLPLAFNRLEIVGVHQSGKVAQRGMTLISETHGSPIISVPRNFSA